MSKKCSTFALAKSSSSLFDVKQERWHRQRTKAVNTKSASRVQIFFVQKWQLKWQNMVFLREFRMSVNQ